MSQSVFPDFLNPLNLLQTVQPPTWLIHEVQQRIVLALNHVLQQEPEAMERLKRQKHKTIALEWAPIEIKVQPTPAGLLNLAEENLHSDTADASTKAIDSYDLSITVLEESPFTALRSLTQNQKPKTRIEGDVQLAAEINWLIDHVRWDVEEDLSRFIGDAAAHRTVSTLQGIATQLKAWIPSPGTSAAEN